MPHIVVIEDDKKTANALRNGLQAEGFEVAVAGSGNEGFRAVSSGAFDLAVLDWMLPERSGLEVLRALRERGIKTPVVLLTARDAIEDRVQGLDAGADDYLLKPFAFAELLARIRALLRRAIDTMPTRWTVGSLTVDLEKRRVTRGEREIALTPHEFDLLAYLARHRGETVTRQMLARDIWHEPRRVTPLDNVIDVHIGHLRRKLEDGQPLKFIHTVRGVGFLLREEGAS